MNNLLGRLSKYWELHMKWISLRFVLAGISVFYLCATNTGKIVSSENYVLSGDDIKKATSRFQEKNENGILVYRACLSNSEITYINAMSDDIAALMNRMRERYTTPQNIEELKKEGPVTQAEQEKALRITQEMQLALRECKFRNSTRRPW